MTSDEPGFGHWTLGTRLLESLTRALIPSVLVGGIVTFTAVKILEDHDNATRAQVVQHAQQIMTLQVGFYRHDALILQAQTQAIADRELAKQQFESIISEVKETRKRLGEDRKR